MSNVAVWPQNIPEEQLDEVLDKAKGNIQGSIAAGFKPSMLVKKDEGPYMMFSPWFIEALVEEVKSARSFANGVWRDLEKQLGEAPAQ